MLIVLPNITYIETSILLSTKSRIRQYNKCFFFLFYSMNLPLYSISYSPQYQHQSPDEFSLLSLTKTNIAQLCSSSFTTVATTSTSSTGDESIHPSLSLIPFNAFTKMLTTSILEISTLTLSQLSQQSQQ